MALVKLLIEGDYYNKIQTLNIKRNDKKQRRIVKLRNTINVTW